MGACSPDVLVVGNGPVGQTAALLLARWGLTVTVLDRRRARDRVGSKAICQQGDVIDIWASVGVGEQIAAEGVTWTTARTFYGTEELFSYQFADPGAARFPPFVNLSQSRTEELLDARVAANPAIEVRWGHEVTAIEQDATAGVQLTCATDDGPVEFRAGYVLACAGCHGDAVRDALGVAFGGHSFADRFLICDIRAELAGWSNERRFYFDPVWNPGRQVLIHPCPDSTFRIDWQVPPDYDLAVDEAGGGLDRRIRAIIGERPYEIVWKSVYSFQSRVASRMQVGRVMLAGDCAHLFAPFGARGLNSGVADAENAAWKIAFVLRGWAPSDLIASYHDERHAAALENLAVTTATMKFFIPPTAAATRQRRALLERARGDARSRARVDSGRLAEPYWYPRSPLICRDPRRAPAARPARGQPCRPGPGVIVPDVPVCVRGAPARSRDLLRSGMTLLVGDDVTDQPRWSGRAPITVHRFGDIDPEGVLRSALGARPDEVWIVRPDAHVAAVLHGADASNVDRALRRSLAMPVAPSD